MMPTLDEQITHESKMERAFWEFHGAHPEVYDVLVRLTRRWQLQHAKKRIGIQTVLETARYTMDLERSDDGFKLNNNHAAYYARLIMEREADLDGIYGLRKQRIASTISSAVADEKPNPQL